MRLPIRVLHMIGAMNRGGAETLIMELYRHMDHALVQFDFMVYNYSDTPGAYDKEIKELGGLIYPMKSRLYKQPVAYQRELRGFFKDHPEYRIVHAHQFATSGYVLAAAKKSDPKRYTISHSHVAFPQTDFLRNVSNLVGKLLLKKYVDYYFGCSDDALIALTGRGADNNNRKVIRNAIDIEKFAFNKEMRTLWRQRIDVDDECLVIGNVARFTYEKNHEHIVSTFSEVSKSQPNCKLVLVGVGSRQEEIKQQVKTIGLNDRVVFLDSRPDVHDIINAFDVFLMPSRYEGLGIVLIEAQANGLPCIISADVIPSEADVNGGMITRLNLDTPHDEWAQMCMNCHRLDPNDAQKAVIAAGYDIKQVAKDLQAFYLEKWRD